MDPKISTGFTLLLVILAGSAAYVYAFPSVIGLPPAYTKEKSDLLFPTPTSTPLVQAAASTTSASTSLAH